MDSVGFSSNVQMPTKEQEVTNLKEQAEYIEQALEDVKKRIEGLSSKTD